MIPTPTCMVYTRAGAIPHLTWDLAAKVLRIPEAAIVQYCLPNMFLSVDSVSKFGKGYQKFAAIPAPLCSFLSFHDPGTQLQTGYNGNKFSSLWTKGGRRTVTPDAMASDIVTILKPDAYQALCDCDTPTDAQEKRLKKSVDRTLKFLDYAVQHKTENCNIFGTVTGGASESERLRCAAEMEPCVDGFVLEGFHMFGDLSEFKLNSHIPLITKVFTTLPPHKPRIFSGALNPSQVLTLVQEGVDIFDTSFCYTLTEKGKGFQLTGDFFGESSDRNKGFVELDFNEKSFADDISPVFDNCCCYTCKHYTKAYINHLLVTEELLGPILLMVHNLQEYLDMFDKIRNRLNFLKDNADDCLNKN